MRNAKYNITRTQTVKCLRSLALLEFVATLLCKHFTYGEPCPFYHRVTINLAIPFIVINECSTRERSQIVGEKESSHEHEEVSVWNVIYISRLLKQSHEIFG